MAGGLQASEQRISCLVVFSASGSSQWLCFEDFKHELLRKQGSASEKL